MSNLKPPLALHEAAIEKFIARDPVTGAPVNDPVFTKLANAMRIARVEGAEQIVSTATAILADPTQTEAARSVQVKQTALRLAERATKALDAARDHAIAEAARVEASIAIPEARDMVEHSRRQEIRSRFSSMPEKERGDALAAAISAGREHVVNALLGAEPFLTGLGPAEHAARLSAWQQQRHPKELDRLRRIRKAVEATERGGSAFIAMVNELAASPQVMLAEAAARQAREAKMAADG